VTNLDYSGGKESPQVAVAVKITMTTKPITITTHNYLFN
jgi:hypothetical protein